MSTYNSLLESTPAEPAEQCPSCGGWFKMGHVCHSSSYSLPGLGSTLYGVCSRCASRHKEHGKTMNMHIIKTPGYHGVYGGAE